MAKSVPQPSGWPASSEWGSHSDLPVLKLQMSSAAELIVYRTDIALPREEQANMISCQASPVAVRKRTKMACGNVWKLLLRCMAVSGSRAIFPNTWIATVKKGHEPLRSLSGFLCAEEAPPACRWRRRWRRAWRSRGRRKAGLERTSWTSTTRSGCLHPGRAIWPSAWRGTAGRSWWRWCCYPATRVTGKTPWELNWTGGQHSKRLTLASE